MDKHTVTLQHIENSYQITAKTDLAFLQDFQNGLLLALKEHGRLTEGQYRQAALALKQQSLHHARKNKTTRADD